MVYIRRDGEVVERRPWSLDRLIGIITGFFALMLYFFRTMLAPILDTKGDMPSSRGNRGGSGGGGGGGGGGPGHDRGFRPKPNRRIGRINTAPESNIPGQGCQSCS